MNDKIGEISIQDTSGQQVNLSLKVGSNFAKCLEMNNAWTAVFVEQLQHLQSTAPTESLADLMVKHSFEDAHWNWLTKSLQLSTSDYMWFSLESSNNVEAAIVIKHPQGSRFDQDEIYYIDYLAIAPWNRSNPLSQRVFKGLGPVLMKEVGKYLNTKLKYREGFSLHSLPQAANFYSKIGMVDFGPDPTKQDLNYFEMNQNEAQGFIYG